MESVKRLGVVRPNAADLSNLLNSERFLVCSVGSTMRLTIHGLDKMTAEHSNQNAYAKRWVSSRAARPRVSRGTHPTRSVHKYAKE